jgi:tetratricopeptide (TPR) repeat protein
MGHIRQSIVSLGLAFTFCLPCSLLSADKEAVAIDLLRDGWKEYQYREFDNAESLFKKAAEKASAKEDKLQALTGQAFCYHFGRMALATASDYANAIAIYRKCLDLAGDDQKFAPFFNSMIAECSYRIYRLTDDDTKLDEANAIWKELQEKHPNSVAAQEALLFKTIMDTKNLKDDSIIAKINTVADRLNSKRPNDAELADANAMTSVMANYLAFVTYWRGDYRSAVHWFKEYLRLGPTSYAARYGTVFRIARISEMKNNDPKTAIAYYSLFAKDFPSNRSKYFAEQKSIELQKAVDKKEAGN